MMNWFGKDWGAPICKTTPHVDAPVGQPCIGCDRPIVADDQGVTMPHMTAVGEAPARSAMHLDCFLESILPFRKPAARFETDHD